MSKPAISTSEEQEKHDRLAAALKARRAVDAKDTLSRESGRRFVMQIMAGNRYHGPFPVGNAASTAQAIGQWTVTEVIRQNILELFGVADGHAMLAKMEIEHAQEPELHREAMGET